MRRFVLASGLVLLITACSHSPTVEKVMTEKEYYDAAQKALKFGSFETATKHLENLESHYPVGGYTEQAQLELIYARYKHLDYAGAVSAAERFIRLHPQNTQIDYAYYVRGLANYESGRDELLLFFGQRPASRDLSEMQLAFSNFNDLLSRYPNSAYAADARQRMIYMRNLMAEAEMHTARFYLKRETYVSALNRSRWVIENYPNTPQVPEALAISSYCYQQLHMADLADNTLKLLKANYPEYVDSKGRPKVDLGPQNEKRSWLHIASFGLLGQKNTTSEPATPSLPPPR